MSFQFESLALSDLVLFRKAEIQLNRTKLAVIRGLNRDSTVPNSNGAGKSLLFNTLPVLFYDTPPTGNQRKAGKSLFQKSGKIVIRGTNGKDHFQATKYQTGKSLKLQIERNDEDLKFRTFASAQQYLHEQFPLTPELFYQLVYLRGAADNVLLNGTPTARHAFFEKLFQLDNYDRVAQELRKMFRELQKQHIELETLRSERRRPENLKEVQDHAEQLDRRASELQKQLNRNAKHLAQADTWNKLAEQLPGKYRDSKVAAAKYHRCQKRSQRALSELLAYQENQTAWKAYAQYREQRQRLQAELSGPKPSLKSLNRDYRKVVHKIQSCRKRLQETDQTDLQIQAKRLYDRLVIGRYQVKQLREGKCPICQGAVAPKADTAAQSRLKAVEKQWLQHRKHFTPATDGPKQRERLKKRLKTLESQESHLETQLNAARKWQHRQQQLDELTAVSKPKEKVSATSREDVDRLETATQEARERYDLSRKLAQLAKPKLSRKQLQDQAKALTLEFDQIRGQQQQLNRRLGIIAEQHQTYRRIQRRIKHLKKSLKHYRLIEALVEAYGPKGLRGFDVNELVSLYVQNLNQFASAVFSEPVQFSFNLGNRTIELLAERPNRSCDICHLSGAERQSFNLLSLLALLPLVPEQYRTNLLILDEIESALSPENRRLLVSELLPRLEQLIPCIFIITPHSEREFYVPNAITYQVTRHRGRSKLELLQ